MIAIESYEISCIISVNTVRGRGVRRNTINGHGRYFVIGQEILRCKCRIVNWKYVTVGVWRL